MGVRGPHPLPQFLAAERAGCIKGGVYTEGSEPQTSLLPLCSDSTRALWTSGLHDAEQEPPTPTPRR